MVLALTLAIATLAFHPSLRALPSRTVARSTSRSVLPLAAAEVAVAEVPLLTSSNLDAWERIDDVIMGGVSSSQLVADGDAVSFEGTLREEGGGFCGQRLKLLTEPLDLSAQAHCRSTHHAPHAGRYVDHYLPLTTNLLLSTHSLLTTHHSPLTAYRTGFTSTASQRRSACGGFGSSLAARARTAARSSTRPRSSRSRWGGSGSSCRGRTSSSCEARGWFRTCPPSRSKTSTRPTR